MSSCNGEVELILHRQLVDIQDLLQILPEFVASVLRRGLVHQFLDLHEVCRYLLHFSNLLILDFLFQFLLILLDDMLLVQVLFNHL